MGGMMTLMRYLLTLTYLFKHKIVTHGLGENYTHHDVSVDIK